MFILRSFIVDRGIHPPDTHDATFPFSFSLPLFKIHQRDSVKNIAASMWPIESIPSVWPRDIVFFKESFSSSNSV